MCTAVQQRQRLGGWAHLSGSGSRFAALSSPIARICLSCSAGRGAAGRLLAVRLCVRTHTGARMPPCRAYLDLLGLLVVGPGHLFLLLRQRGRLFDVAHARLRTRTGAWRMWHARSVRPRPPRCALKAAQPPDLWPRGPPGRAGGQPALGWLRRGGARTHLRHVLWPLRVDARPVTREQAAGGAARRGAWQGGPGGRTQQVVHHPRARVAVRVLAAEGLPERGPRARTTRTHTHARTRDGRATQANFAAAWRTW